MSPRTRTTSARPPASSIESDGEDLTAAAESAETRFFTALFVATARLTGFFFAVRGAFLIGARVRAAGAGGGVGPGGGDRRVGSRGAGAGGGWTA